MPRHANDPGPSTQGGTSEGVVAPKQDDRAKKNGTEWKTIVASTVFAPWPVAGLARAIACNGRAILAAFVLVRRAAISFASAAVLKPIGRKFKVKHRKTSEMKTT